MAIERQVTKDLCAIIVEPNDSRRQYDKRQISGGGSTGETIASQDARVKRSNWFKLRSALLDCIAGTIRP